MHYLQYKHGWHGGNAEEQWRKHVMATLWIVVVLVIAIAASLVYADAHGMFRLGAEPGLPASSWPDNLP